MATNSIVYGFEDKYGHKSYSGFTFAENGASTTPAQVTAFSTIVKKYSDANHIQSAVKLAVDVVPSAAAGDTNIERRGVVVIKDVASGRRFNVSIHALKAAAVDPQGSAKSALTDACESDILAAWQTITGLTGKVVASYSDGSQFQR